MTDVLLGIGVAAFVVYAVFQIMYIRSMKRASDRMAEFFQNIEANLSGTLSELRDTLENMKKITGNVREVTEDVRQIAGTAASVERNIRVMYRSAKESLGTATEARIAGLKAGIRTGVVTLVRNLQEGRGDDHEGRTGEEGK